MSGPLVGTDVVRLVAPGDVDMFYNRGKFASRYSNAFNMHLGLDWPVDPHLVGYSYAEVKDCEPCDGWGEIAEYGGSAFLGDGADIIEYDCPACGGNGWVLLDGSAA